MSVNREYSKSDSFSRGIFEEDDLVEIDIKRREWIRNN